MTKSNANKKNETTTEEPNASLSIAELEEKYLGKEIISTEVGVCKILSIQKIDENSDNFFVVESKEGRLRHYFPINGVTKYRFIATKKKLEDILKSINGKLERKKYDSKKDRINYFKNISRSQDIHELFIAYIDLCFIEDLGTIEKTIMDRCFATLVVEYTKVFEISEEEGKELILNKIKELK